MQKASQCKEKCEVQRNRGGMQRIKIGKVKFTGNE